jgi:hypothetical protein
MTIVRVVADEKQDRLDKPAKTEVYLPLSQSRSQVLAEQCPAGGDDHHGWGLALGVARDLASGNRSMVRAMTLPPSAGGDVTAPYSNGRSFRTSTCSS